MSRARVMAALAGEPVRALGLAWVSPGAVRQLTFERGIENDAEGLAAVASAFGVDLAFVDASAPWAAEAVRLLHSEDIAAAWAVSGALSRVASHLGWTETMKASAGEPGVLAYALDTALHELLQETRTANLGGADVLVVADELASTAGWLVSPDFVLDALIPCYARVASEWGEAPAVFHSDGDVRALYLPLRRAGFAGVHLALADQAHTALAAKAARAAGLVPLGGVRALGLRAEGARRSAEVAHALAVDAPFVVTDDGGMTSAEELAAYGAVLDGVRAADGDLEEK